MHNYCVILAGGVGAQFWPLTREDKPKQFQPILPDGPSFLQETYNRAKHVFPEDRIFIVSLSRYRDLLLEQFPGIAEDHLLLEPYGRGTANSIAFASRILLARDPEAVMVVTPCDHLITDGDSLAKALCQAIDCASQANYLLTLGIVPTFPNTAFGYVQVQGGKDAYKEGKPVKAKTFTEKPSAELAQVFIDSGEFLWNTGIFVWKASSIVEEMQRCCPEISNLWKGWEKSIGTADETRFVEKVYADSPNISIDYAVLEKSSRLYVLPADFGWSDAGSYTSYYDASPYKDEDGNLSIGVRGALFKKECKGNILCCSSSRKLLAVRGLENYVVIDTDDVLLISPKDEDILKDNVREMNCSEYEEYR